ncbi:XdhC family protein [Bacillus alveayuensis]|uniref:XdhC family protein n=1 Tax=Aeribacillus alveayuensis TaxID=279215 RepID=UPI0005D1290E|nr:XdhC/CoxI family protein [Bacillus alveayuensis]
MNENKRIIDALLKNARENQNMALATVVKVSGSAYKREGSKMLIDKKGGTNGLISGGCLERDVAEVALQVMESGQPILKRYDLDEDLVWGLGLGCPGIVDIYIEPITGTALDHLISSELQEPEQDIRRFDPFQEWIKCLQQEKVGVLATIIKSSTSVDLLPGNRMFITENRNPVGQLGKDELNQIASEIAYQKIQQQSPKSETRTITLSNGEWVDIFIDVNVPVYELVIFGAGHDAIPLSKFSLQLGFKTTVVDSRPAYATTERFPGAQIVLADADHYSKQLVIGPRTYIVIMNHHIERDQASLEFALQTVSPYVGVLGPRSRCNKMLEALQLKDVPLKQMYNPIGLDIGAESSEEIALSILAEILAVRNRHAGGFLSKRKGIESSRIHQPI